MQEAAGSAGLRPRRSTFKRRSGNRKARRLSPAGFPVGHRRPGSLLVVLFLLLLLRVDAAGDTTRQQQECKSKKYDFADHLYTSNIVVNVFLSQKIFFLTDYLRFLNAQYIRILPIIQA